MFPVEREPSMPKPLDYATRLPKLPRRLPSVNVYLAVVFAGLLALPLLRNRFFPPLVSRPANNPVKCGAHLKAIGQAILLYARHHQGRYPDSLGELVTEGLTPADFICPESDDEPANPAPTTQATIAGIDIPGHLSYIYLAQGRTPTTPRGDLVLAYEPLSNHQAKGMNILFGDGHVEWFNPQLAAKWLPQLSAGHNPPGKEALR